MGYLPTTTIAETLKRIQTGDLILPAIQREYVWRPDQIVRLFDSLMRGYPIGGFLSWKVEPDTASQFRFYGFLKDYNELNNRHNPGLDLVRGQAATAVLDGQQRLTSLNIGLRGKYAARRKWGRLGDPSHYPPMSLYLNTRSEAKHNDAGLIYDFQFLTDAMLDEIAEDERPYWFPVHRVYEAESAFGVYTLAADAGLGNDKRAVERLSELWQVVHTHNVVNFYEETDQDIERVLDIFIRVNSGGTVLSYSDLLLSIATAQWKERDAREAVHGLVDRLNAVGQGFDFSKDLVLKSGLVLTDVSDVGFKVKNFTSENMSLLDDQWDRIGSSLEVAAGLLADFGLSQATLSADSVMIPVAYYVHTRGLTHHYRESPGDREDRAAMKSWVLRSLVASGIWGSGLDSLLRDLREGLRQHGEREFPVAELERRMNARGKSLALTEDRIEELLTRSYGSRGTFALLGALFPHVNTRNVHHVDHVFPANLLSRKSLKAEGLGSDAIDRIEVMRDQLPNLQLMEGLENISKSDMDPFSWAQTHFSTDSGVDHYLMNNRLPELPRTAAEFEDFFTTRRTLLAATMRERLGDGSLVGPS